MPTIAARPEEILARASPKSGAIVMGTGIVSIAPSLDGRETRSRILLVICAAMWAVLAALLLIRLRFDRGRVDQEARSPSAPTSVAATEVLGSRLTLLGWHWAGIAALVIALAARSRALG